MTVGWVRAEDKGAILYAPPERVRTEVHGRPHAKPAARCSAVMQMESRYLVLRSPRDDQGQAQLVSRTGSAGSIRASSLGQALVLVREAEWRHPDRPVVQLKLPWCLVADETCYATQLDSFAHCRRDPLPGTILGGRFPVHAWVRQLMWGLEGHDTARDILLRRGDPLFYLQCEAEGPNRPVNVIAVERSPEIEAWMAKLSGVTNHVNQTFSLFKAAEALRPAAC